MEATFNIYKAAVQYQQPKVTNDNLIIIKIKEVIKEVTGISWEQINQATRQREIMLSRQLFHFLCRKFTSQSLKFIGSLTTRSYDHSTVISSIEQITYIILFFPPHKKKRKRFSSLNQHLWLITVLLLTAYKKH